MHNDLDHTADDKKREEELQQQEDEVRNATRRGAAVPPVITGFPEDKSARLFGRASEQSLGEIDSAIVAPTRSKLRIPMLLAVLAIGGIVGWQVIGQRHAALPSVPPLPGTSSVALESKDDGAPQLDLAPNPIRVDNSSAPTQTEQTGEPAQAEQPIVAAAQLNPEPVSPTDDRVVSVEATEPQASTDKDAAAPEAAPPPSIPVDANLNNRLDRIEAMLEQLQTRFAGPASAPAVVSPSVSTHTRTRAAPRRPRPAPAAVTAQSKPPALAGQLLSVDMWNGVASVVIGTGMPDDRRMRVLRQGDTYNGITLQSVDPVAKTATFRAGTATERSFTLSMSEGG